jgi:hypothetical protein
VRMSGVGGRHLALTGVTVCALCVAYFHVVDRFLFSSIHFSPIFRFLLAKYDVRAAWLALGVGLLAAFWARPAPILRLVDFVARHAIGIGIATTAVLSLGAVLVYHDYPLSMDEYAAVFQSKIFASGKIAAHMPPNLVDWLVVRGFNGSFLVGSSQSGRVIEAYWPGFALVLAPFQLANVPWLCNASLSGIAIFLIYWITKEITGDRRAGGWAMLFALASGAFAANGISYYSMQAHLTANLLFAALLIRPSGYRAFGAGMVGSLALILHNPVPHALFATPWIAVMVLQSDRRLHLIPLLLGYLPGVAIGINWFELRSEIELTSHWSMAANPVASGVFAWPSAAMLNSRVAALMKMCVWAMPCLFVFALLGFVRRRGDIRVRLLAASAILTFVAYVFVIFDQGHGWGYRYFHSAWSAVPILAACAMANRSEADSRLISFAGALAILSLLLIVPFQMIQIEGFISEHLSQLDPPRRPGNNVYLIHPLGGFYAADMIQSDPFLRNQDLLMVSHGAELDAQLIRQNWPNAVRVSTGRVADQWYLGAEDQRLSIPAGKHQRQFVIAHVPP